MYPQLMDLTREIHSNGLTGIVGTERTAYFIGSGDERNNTSSITTEGNDITNEPMRRVMLRDSLYIVVPITVIYAVIFFTGIVGNIVTCIVIVRNRSMHTATNYYLFSLAVSDLLLLITGLPPEIYIIWSKFPYVFGEAFCIIQGFAAETSANATVLTITTFTVERYVAICRPFLSHTMSKLSRVIKIIIVIWILAMSLAIPQAMSFGLVYLNTRSDEYAKDDCVCIIKRVIISRSFEISACIFFAAPMLIIITLYVLIALQLRKPTVSRSSDRRNKPITTNLVVQVEETGTQPTTIGYPNHQFDENDGRKNFGRDSQTKATKRIVKMLVAVVVAFFICWAPFHIQRLLAVYWPNPDPKIRPLLKGSTYASGVLYYLSSTINPLLYNIMSSKFREAFKDTLTCFVPGRRHRRRGRFNSTFSGKCSQLSSHGSYVSGTSNVSYISRQNSTRQQYEKTFSKIDRCQRPTDFSRRSFNQSGSNVQRYNFSKRSLNEAELSRRYTNDDTAKRPLVVSFRRPKMQNQNLPKINGDREIKIDLFGGELTSLSPEYQTDSLEIFPSENVPSLISSTKNISQVLSRKSGDENYLDVEKFKKSISQDKNHISSTGTEINKHIFHYPQKLEDIEIFQEQILKIKSKKSNFPLNNKDSVLQNESKPETFELSKSTTMPKILSQEETEIPSELKNEKRVVGSSYYEIKRCFEI